jgi:hypothetical protein
MVTRHPVNPPARAYAGGTVKPVTIRHPSPDTETGEKMGFDIVGKAPRNEAGECFRINNGGWRELKNLCFFAAPEICSQIDVVHWSTNEGYGLDDPRALALADAL